MLKDLLSLGFPPLIFLDSADEFLVVADGYLVVADGLFIVADGFFVPDSSVFKTGKIFYLGFGWT